ncbi:MAG: ribosome-associated translation inhibitor RaiA [Kineosporiaceae bacterium]
MEIVITGRHTDVSERFRRLAEEKLAKVGQLAPKAHRADVELSHERNPRQTQTAEKVEITLRGKGPVIRAEARAEESGAALDLALGKLLERLRRSGDRRKVHHGRQRPASVRVPGAIAANGTAAAVVEDELGELEDPYADQNPDSPVVIRTKDHSAPPMTVEQALYEMELVQHDFFLFQDSECGLPSVVYRRHGWNYGVIRLTVPAAPEAGNVD